MNPTHFKPTLVRCPAHSHPLILLYLALFSGIGMALLLAGCTSPTYPIQITHVSVNPDPIVGQVVTVTAQIMSTQDEYAASASIHVYSGTLESQVHLIRGSEWQGALLANHPVPLQATLCVLQEGEWPVVISAGAQNIYGASTGTDLEITHLHSTLESGWLIREKDFRIDQTEIASRPTPRPFTVSPECSGQNNSEAKP